jgi:hypothetical protein
MSRHFQGKQAFHGCGGPVLKAGLLASDPETRRKDCHCRHNGNCTGRTRVADHEKQNCDPRRLFRRLLLAMQGMYGGMLKRNHRIFRPSIT